MGGVFRKVTTKSLPAGAEVVTHRGRPHARWRTGDRVRTVPLSADGNRLAIESANW